ncbi:hypothetical protein ACRAWD_03960 [Caulobacter segnis]
MLAACSAQAKQDAAAAPPVQGHRRRRRLQVAPPMGRLHRPARAGRHRRDPPARQRLH